MDAPDFVEEEVSMREPELARIDSWTFLRQRRPDLREAFGTLRNDFEARAWVVAATTGQGEIGEADPHVYRSSN